MRDESSNLPASPETAPPAGHSAASPRALQGLPAEPIPDPAIVLQRVADGVIALNSQWRCTFANAAASRLLVGAGPLQGAHLPSALTMPEFQPIIETVKRAVEHGAATVCRLASPNDSATWCRVYPAPDGVTILLMDLSDEMEHNRELEAALAESRRHTQAIAEATPAVIVISRRSDSRILYANPFARALFGVAPDADLSDRTSAEFYQNPNDRAEIVARLADTPRIGPIEIAVKRLDGTPIWVEGGFQLLTYNGEEAVLATHHDINERRQREAERERALREAQDRADRDPLTGLLNHRAFFRRLEEETVRARREGTSLAVAMLDLDNFKFFNDIYGHSVGDEVLRKVAERLLSICRPYDVVSRYGGDEFALILGGVDSVARRDIEARLTLQTQDLRLDLAGHGSVPITLSVGVAFVEEQGRPHVDVLKLADARLIRAKARLSYDLEAETVRARALREVEGFEWLDALVTAVDAKDRFTRRHSEDVLAYSLLIARRLGLDETEQRNVAIAGLLHDVGKLAIADSILRKPGELTDEELEQVNKHAQIGALIIGSVRGLDATHAAVRHHHERWDGGGFPEGLAGEACPLLARILAVADAFSAMTTDQPYRHKMSAEQALATLEAGAGAQWDPECVRALVEARKELMQRQEPPND